MKPTLVFSFFELKTAGQNHKTFVYINIVAKKMETEGETKINSLTKNL